MDATNNSGVNTSHLPRPENTNNGYNMENSFLGGIQSFADSADASGAADAFSDFLHPDLLIDSGSNSEPQPQPSYESAFNQHASRQSNSPALPQYNAGQSAYSTQPSYPPQPMYDSRSIYQQQQTFDPRMYQPQRSNQSPAPPEQFSYSNAYSHNYANQQLQQRHSSTPVQQYPPPRQQTYSPLSGWDSRAPNSFTQSYPAFQEQNQHSSQTFINPSMINGVGQQLLGNNLPSLAPRQHFQPSPYFSKPAAGVTIDPRNLQGQQQQIMLNQHQHLHQQQPHVVTQNGLPIPFQGSLIPKTKQSKDPSAPKRPRGRPRKDGLPSGQPGEQDEDYASDSELEIDPEVKPAIISVSMPADPRGQVLYKVIDAVWCDRNNPAPVETIKRGIAEVGNTLKVFRDLWKVKNDDLKKAELDGSSTAAQAPALKKAVSDDRVHMGTIMDYAVRFGHPSTLKSLGENPLVMSAMYSFMLDRVTAGDLDSTMVASILKLAVLFETVDEAKLETLKWTKLLQRLTKKATSESKSLAQKIITNATNLTAKKQANSDKSSPKPNGENGMKRVRDGENGQPAPKKTLLKPSSKPLALQNAERRRALEKEEAAKKAKAAKEVSSTNGAAAELKPKAAPPPKTTPIAALMSASKKPGTSNAERAAAAKDRTAGPTPIKREPVKLESPPRTQSSFLGILSDFDKKKEVKAEKEDVPLNETPDQRAKRLRKESRRKLRVSWKADSELVETRLFTHDPDEEVDPENSMMKDADGKNEGAMLKRGMPLTDIGDDEEDDEEDIEDTYSPPSEVDFTAIVERVPDADFASNAIKYGGPVEAESASKMAQEKLEAATLMAVFDSKTDRPISPKEPPDDGEDGDFQPCVDFGEPDARVREREREIYSRQHAAAANGYGVSQAAQPMGAIPPGSDIQSILSMLAMQQPSAVQPAGAAPPVDFKSLVENAHKAKQQPPTVPYQAPAASLDLKAFLANYNQGGAPAATLGKHGLEDAEDSEAKKNKYPPNYKTQVCTFWKEGRCTKGDNCTYKHAD